MAVQASIKCAQLIEENFDRDPVARRLLTPMGLPQRFARRAPVGAHQSTRTQQGPAKITDHTDHNEVEPLPLDDFVDGLPGRSLRFSAIAEPVLLAHAVSPAQVGSFRVPLNQGLQKLVGLNPGPDMSGVGQEGRTLDALAMLGFAINGDEALI